MRVRLNSYGAHGRPGDVVELDDGQTAPLLAGGAAHPVGDDELVEALLDAGVVYREQIAEFVEPAGQDGPA